MSKQRPEDHVAAEIKTQLDELQRRAKSIFLGRRVRFVGEFNGQPRGGRSRKPLTGKEAVITAVFLSEREGVTFHSCEPRWITAGFGLNHVEFVRDDHD